MTTLQVRRRVNTSSDAAAWARWWAWVYAAARAEVEQQKRAKASA